MSAAFDAEKTEEFDPIVTLPPDLVVDDITALATPRGAGKAFALEPYSRTVKLPGSVAEGRSLFGRAPDSRFFRQVIAAAVTHS